MANIDFEMAARFERELRHDVMAHIRTFAVQCPKAAPIIHLGATSCFIGDNADLIVMREACAKLETSLSRVINNLCEFAALHRNLACLAFTHLQPAQLTTVGKRAALWAQDLLLDLHQLQWAVPDLIKFRGIKGTTGTQASYLDLFQGDHERVEELDVLVAAKAGFSHHFLITGQTYPRKLDTQLLCILATCAATCHKIATDLRLLASKREIEEPFDDATQVGSSAMPYKRNPILSERCCALARHVMCLTADPLMTQSIQWLERSLDDSANRRICIPEAFLAADGMLRVLDKISGGLIVYPKMIERNLAAEMPFISVERLMMSMVRDSSGDRQECHERLRKLCLETSNNVKIGGASNDLIEKIKKDEYFRSVWAQLDDYMRPELYIGRSPEQIDRFLASPEIVNLQEKYKVELAKPMEVIDI